MRRLWRSKDLPERIHDEVVGAIDVTQFKNMRDLNKKTKDTFVERIKAITEKSATMIYNVIVGVTTQ